jgi:hypothetical protein
MFEQARYGWGEAPPDGGYEAQFDRYEGDRAVLVVVDDGPVGTLSLPADEVPGLDADPSTTALRARVVDGELVDLTHDPERSAELHAAGRAALDALGEAEDA